MFPLQSTRVREKDGETTYHERYVQPQPFESRLRSFVVSELPGHLDRHHQEPQSSLSAVSFQTVRRPTFVVVLPESRSIVTNLLSQRWDFW